jgi:hypothetical protein
MECNFEVYPPRKAYDETIKELDQLMGVIKPEDDELYTDVGGEG